MIRAAIVLLVAYCCATAPLSATTVELQRVWPSYRTADSFEGIAEYLGGKEPTHGRTVLRTKPDSRDGFYFLARTHADAPIEGASLHLEIILPGSTVPKQYAFPVNLRSGKQVFQVGLTGPDWPGKKTHPIAWKLTVVGPDGAALANSQSFLWAQP